MIHLKRAYDPPGKKDGFRVLVDRIWPRGASKADAKIDCWMKIIAPSDDLRKWFNHDPEKWKEFRQKYREELKNNKKEISQLLKWADGKLLTLVYGAKDRRHNNAVALKEFLEDRLKTDGGASQGKKNDFD